MSASPEPPDAAALAAALATIGVPCDVERRGRLALLVPRDAELLADPAHRREVQRLAQRHGFTHVALELVDDDAPLPRAEPAR